MFQLFVEGHGEVKAAGKLVHKIVAHYGWPEIVFSKAHRWPNLHTEDALSRAIALARIDTETEGVLILRDDEDNCPAEKAPEAAAYIKSLNAPFPVAYCLMYREFETLFVAYADEFVGKDIARIPIGSYRFIDTMQSPENPESKRDAKGWLTEHLPKGRAYKPTTDQLALTTALDIGLLAAKGLPCFGTLCRCIDNLITHRGEAGFVYPS